MRRRFAIAVALAVGVSSISAQSPYELDVKRDLAIFGGATVLGITSLVFHKNIDPLTMK